MTSVVSSLVRSIASSTVLGAGGAVVSEPAQFIVNGGFATDTDWTKGAGWTIAAGVASNSGSATSLTGALVQALIPGRSYTLSFDYTLFLGGTSLNPTLIGAVMQSLPDASADPTPYSVTFVATSANTSIRFVNADPEAGTLDNVSLVPA